jgi:Na+(H+)/acetate symporter ActP
MNPVTLKRIAIAGAILTVLVAIDGLYMVLANYKPDDTSGNGFGSFHPSDGQTVLIAAGLLLVITIIAFILSSRAQQKVESPVKQEVEPEAKA